MQPFYHIEPLCKSTEELFAPARKAANDRLHIEVDKELKHFICTVYAVGMNDAKVAPSVFGARAWCMKVPERKELDYGKWRFKATDVTATIINSQWDRNHVSFEGNAKTVFDYLMTRFVQQTVNARAKAVFKEQGILPPLHPGWKDHPEMPLAPYQTMAAVTACFQEGAALFMEQGTGKTPTAIRRIMHEAESCFATKGRPYRVIISAPKNVRINWQNELTRFATSPGKVAILRGGGLDRVKSLVELMSPDPEVKWIVAVTSFESVQRSWSALQLCEWDLAILDESHNIKSPTTKRTQQFMLLRDKCAARMVLTGTPVANNIVDIYSQLEFLGEGMSGFSSFTAFKQFYNRFEQSADGQRMMFAGYKNMPILQERLARVAVMLTKKEVLPDLPQKQYDIEEIELTEEQLEYYTTMRDSLAVEIEADMAKMEGNVMMTANNALTKLLRLGQVTSGYLMLDSKYDDDGNAVLVGKDRVRFFKTNPKIDQLLEDLAAKDPTQKTIVWTHQVPMIAEIGRRLTEAGIKHVTYFGGTSESDREAAQHAFNNDAETKVFIGNPAAGGVGMNLPGYNLQNDSGCNADHVIYFSSSWSHIHRAQSEDRNHGKNRCRVPVRYTDYIAPSTIDQEVHSRLLAKAETALEIQDIKSIMQRLLHASLVRED